MRTKVTWNWSLHLKNSGQHVGIYSIEANSDLDCWFAVQQNWDKLNQKKNIQIIWDNMTNTYIYYFMTCLFSWVLQRTRHFELPLLWESFILMVSYLAFLQLLCSLLGLCSSPRLTPSCTPLGPVPSAPCASSRCEPWRSCGYCRLSGRLDTCI